MARLVCRASRTQDLRPDHGHPTYESILSEPFESDHNFLLATTYESDMVPIFSNNSLILSDMSIR